MSQCHGVSSVTPSVSAVQSVTQWCHSVTVSTVSLRQCLQYKVSHSDVTVSRCQQCHSVSVCSTKCHTVSVTMMPQCQQCDKVTVSRLTVLAGTCPHQWCEQAISCKLETGSTRDQTVWSRLCQRCEHNWRQDSFVWSPTVFTPPTRTTPDGFVSLARRCEKVITVLTLLNPNDKK